jgi:NitT/TauT family transport system substrate-binding protein
LRGKRVGIYTRGNIDWIVMRAVALKNYGFDLETSVTMQEGAITLLWGLLDQGRLDAAQMYNSLTPAMVATGKYRVLTTIRGLIEEMGLPAAPFILYTVDMGYAAAHPANVRAFLAAYREAIGVLRSNDEVWIEHGHEMKLDDPAVVGLFRDEARADMIDRFDVGAETDIRKTFNVLLATAGPEVMGMSTLPADFMTMAYQ